MDFAFLSTPETYFDIIVHGTLFTLCNAQNTVLILSTKVCFTFIMIILFLLDGINFIKDPFIKEAPSIKKAEFESYSLESVSQAILGSGKLIKGKVKQKVIYYIGTADTLLNKLNIKH